MKAISFLLFFGLLPLVLSAKIMDLTELESKELKNGGVVVKKTPIKGRPWPVVEVYQLINVEPKEALAIFVAYDHQKDYVPGILKSKPIRQISPTEVITEYEFKTPWPLKNSLYVQGAKWSQTGSQTYQANWYRVSSDSTIENNGHAIFQSYGNQTIFKYHVYIYPQSFFAGALKDIMPKDVEQSVRQIGLYIERLKQENSPILSKYVKVLEQQSKGLYAY
jgi:hypothetical protein